jgi:hypothetical protein
VGRGLPLAAGGERSWRQTSLYPPTHLHVRLDLGWHPAERVGMFAGEAYVPTTRELVALEVHPARRYANIHAWLGHATNWQTGIVLDLFDPDPFG